MKHSAFLSIMAAAGLALATYSCSCDKQETASSSTIEDIMTRTSVRAYTGQEVESGKIDTLLRAAMAAPTAANKQPWRFVVINEKPMLDSISANFRSMSMAQNASVAIVMCGDSNDFFEGDAREYWVQDVSAATENLLLAAHAMKLGAVWCGIYPIPDNVAKFSKLLHLPENIIPMACVCIGYPDGATTPKDKWKPENIQYNTWKE